MFARKHILSTTVKIYKQNCHDFIITPTTQQGKFLFSLFNFCYNLICHY